MAESHDLMLFWRRLEGARELKLARVLWREILGGSSLESLVRSTLLQRAGQASGIPCRFMNGDRCPRVISQDRTRASCGNTPPECDAVELAPGDIDEFVVTEDHVAAKLSEDLQFQGHVDRRSEGVWYLGKQNDDRVVVLVSTRNREQWAEKVLLLREIADRSAFVVWVPSLSYVRASTVREIEELGGLVLSLDSHVRLVGDRFTCDRLPPPSPSPRSTSSLAAEDPEFVAEVLVNGSWRHVGEQEYQSLLAREREFEIFLNQLERRCSRGGTENRKEATKVWNRLFLAYWKALKCARSPFIPQGQRQNEVQKARIEFEGKQAEIAAPLVITWPGAGPRGETGYGYQHDAAARPSHAAIFFPGNSYPPQDL